MEIHHTAQGRCLPQAQSPLFSTIPGEIRNYIFKLALARYEDKSRPYSADAYYHRPGYTCEHRSDLRLLRTCHRIYTEARHLPLQGLRATLWFQGEERRPPGQSNGVYYRRLETYAAAGIDSVHVLAQMYWLENRSLCFWLGSNSAIHQGEQQFVNNLKHLTITVRHTDWWWWESSEPLMIDNTWIESYVAPKSLQDFKLELEVPSRKEMELDSLVNHLIRYWTFCSERETPSRDPATFSTKQSMPTVDTWSGSAIFDGVNHEPERKGTIPGDPTAKEEADIEEAEPIQPKVIDYVVVTMTWLPFREEPAKFDWQPAKGGLKWEPIASS